MNLYQLHKKFRVGKKVRYSDDITSTIYTISKVKIMQIETDNIPVVYLSFSNHDGSKNITWTYNVNRLVFVE